MNQNENQVHIGVDVSKEKLDVYNPIDGSIIEVANDINGFRRLRDLARKHKAIVCCEPTGGYELDMILFMQRFEVPVAYCDGYKVRHFAKACGKESKNDSIDAKMISHFADSTTVRVLSAKERKQLQIRQRFNHYKTFVDIHAKLVQKASAEPDSTMRKLLLSESKRAFNTSRKLLRMCEEITRSDERLSNLLDRFLEIDGVGHTTALAIIAWLPEIGTIKNTEIANLVGLAPKENQSGTISHIRYCIGGRKNVRCALYLATLSCIQHNHILSAYYHKLKQRIPGHKASKWAMVPVMRKLLHLMNKLAAKPDFRLQKKPQIKAV